MAFRETHGEHVIGREKRRPTRACTHAGAWTTATLVARAHCSPMRCDAALHRERREREVEKGEPAKPRLGEARSRKGTSGRRKRKELYGMQSGSSSRMTSERLDRNNSYNGRNYLDSSLKFI